MDFRRIFAQAGDDNPNATLGELSSLIPAAARHAIEDRVGVVAAWALASLDNPQKLRARFAVDKLMGCFHSSGNIERALKVAAERAEARKGPSAPETVSDLSLVALYAPNAQDVSERRGGALVPRGPYVGKIRESYTRAFGSPRETSNATERQRRQEGHRAQGPPPCKEGPPQHPCAIQARTGGGN